MSQGPLAPILDERLVTLTGAHVATVRRWKKRGRVARWLACLVRVCIQGELDDVDRAWRGWKIRNGELVSPEGSTYTPGAVRAGHLWKCRAIELGALRRKQTAAIEADPANNEHLERLALMHRALEQAQGAFDQVTRRLTASERNRVYCSEPQRGGVQRGQRPVIIHTTTATIAQGQSTRTTSALRPNGQECGVRNAATIAPMKT
jgi:uncharacterized protein DUF3653